jgi:signal transduction histidine kinase
LDLSGYRIVQEALTNVIKHGGANARVMIGYTSDE